MKERLDWIKLELKRLSNKRRKIEREATEIVTVSNGPDRGNSFRRVRDTHSDQKPILDAIHKEEKRLQVLRDKIKLWIKLHGDLAKLEAEINSQLRGGGNT